MSIGFFFAGSFFLQDVGSKTEEEGGGGRGKARDTVFRGSKVVVVPSHKEIIRYNILPQLAFPKLVYQ